jgi:hypothetical protein
MRAIRLRTNDENESTKLHGRREPVALMKMRAVALIKMRAVALMKMRAARQTDE